MSGLINLIKSLFSGIFGFIGGLLGGKKADPALNQKKGNSGFYLEMADSAAPAPNSVPMTVSAEAAAKAASPAVNGAKSSRKEKLAALAKVSESGKAQATAPDSTAVPQPVAAAVATKAPEPEERNFATRYLLTSNNGTRRRPGANMSSYLDMARKMKV